jgi:hypothetical protein
MSKDTDRTIHEIEATRENLARNVDQLVGQAKVEAAAAGKKLAIGVIALAGLFIVGAIAKRRVQG